MGFRVVGFEVGSCFRIGVLRLLGPRSAGFVSVGF